MAWQDDSLIFDALKQQGGISAGRHLGWPSANPQAAYEAKRAIAKAQRKAEEQQRIAQIRNETTPNMRGFFPAYSEGVHGVTVTGFDTETDDYSKPIEVAGLQLTYNFTKQRFEQVKGATDSSQFLQYYNSPGNYLTRTSTIHGYTSNILAALTGDPSLTWTKGEYKKFKNWAVNGDSILMGHNIAQADLSWIQGKKSGGFIPENSALPFLDTLHLATAIRGRAKNNPITKESDGRNKLQTIAKEYGVDAASLGLEAHKGYNDVIVTFKVMEELLKRFPNHPAVKEYLIGLKYGNVQTKYWSRPSEGYGHNFSREGFMIHGVKGGHIVGNAYDDLDELIAEATGQMSTADVRTGYDAEGNNTGFSMEDLDMQQAIEETETFKSPETKLKNVTADTLGTGRAEFTRIAEKMFRAGASPRRVEDTIKVLAKGYDTALDPQMFDAVISAGRMISGKAAKYNEWQEIQRVRDSARMAKVKDYRNTFATMADIAYLGAEKYRGLAAKYNSFASKHGMTPAQYLYTGGKKIEGARAEARALMPYMNAADTATNFSRMAANAEKGQKISLADVGENRTEADFEEWLKWGSESNPLYDKEWYRISDRLDAEALQEHKNSFSKGLELRMNKQNVLDNTDYLAGYQQKQFADRTHDMVESLEEYQKAVKDTVKTNKAVESTFKAISSAGRGLYNPAGYWSAQIEGTGEVGHAINGLLPPMFRQAGGRATTAVQQLLKADIAPKQNLWNQLTNVGNMLTAGGGAVMAFNPIAGAVLSGVGATTSLISNVVGGGAQTKITEATNMLAGRINLLSASFSALFAPLKLFRSGLNGFLGLYGKFANIMGIRYGIPYTDLTGISSSHYSAMLDSDSAFGLKAGTVNNMHNNMAYGQAGLYTSGQFDTNRLIAAARMGVFSSVYAPMGGSTEEQMSNTIDTLSRRMAGADNRTKQEIMYFAKAIDPAMPEILERMAKFREAGIYTGGFAGFQNGSAFRRVQQWHMSDRENARWEWASAEFSASRHQTDMALKRIATPLWDNIGLPIANAINEALNKIPSLITPNGINWEGVKEAGKQFWGKVTETLGIGGKSPDDLLKSGLKEVEKFFGSELGKALKNGIWEAIQWIADKESLLLDALKPLISRVAEYINGIEFGFVEDPNSTFGYRFGITTPQQAYARDKASLDKSTAEAKRHAETLPSAWSNISWREGSRDQLSIWQESLGDLMAGFTDKMSVTDATVLADMLSGSKNVFAKGEYLRKNLKPYLEKLQQLGKFKTDVALDSLIDNIAKPILDLAPGAINSMKDVSYHEIKLTDTSGKLVPAMEEQVGTSELMKMGVTINGNTMRFVTAVTKE